MRSEVLSMVLNSVTSLLELNRGVRIFLLSMTTFAPTGRCWHRTIWRQHASSLLTAIQNYLCILGFFSGKQHLNHKHILQYITYTAI